ncbi:MAG: hypothetical protein D0530_04985 [Methylococcales bacterium]|nr:MAG: hypothetical protein D0530_04985 [Methylococcales bacterium]
MSKLLDNGALNHIPGKFTIGEAMSILATKTAEIPNMVTQTDKHKPEDIPITAQGDAIAPAKVSADPRFRQVSAKGDGKAKSDAVGQPRLDNPTLPGTNVEKDMPAKAAAAAEVKDDVRFRKVGPSVDKNSKEKTEISGAKKEAMLARLKSGNIAGLAKAAYFYKYATASAATHNKIFILDRISTPEGFSALTKASMLKQAIGTSPDLSAALGGAAGGPGMAMGGGMPEQQQPSTPEAPSAEQQIYAGQDGLKHKALDIFQKMLQSYGNVVKYTVQPQPGAADQSATGGGQQGMDMMGGMGMGPLAGGMQPLMSRIKPGGKIPGMA